MFNVDTPQLNLRAFELLKKLILGGKKKKSSFFQTALKK